jgi:DNA-binding FadR family transcriptional regulator
MRLILEMGLADLLFEHKTDKDIEVLWEIVKREEASTTEEVRVVQDVLFHSELYRIARNPLLVRFQTLLQPFVKKAAEAGTKSGSKTHRDLVEELASGTTESFQVAMRGHLDPYFK